MSNQMSTRKLDVTVLLSGGIDSSAALAAFCAEGNAVEALFVDYCQPSRRSEWAAAQAVARHYDVTLTKFRLGLSLPCQDGEFFGRNALLVLLAGAVSKRRPLVIAAGIHATSHYYDTTAAFVGDLQHLLDGYTGGCDPFLRTSRTHRLRMEGQGGDSAITCCSMPGAIPGPCDDQGTPSPPR